MQEVFRSIKVPKGTNGYRLFTAATRDNVKDSLGPDGTDQDVMLKLGARWKALSEQQKQEWMDQAKAINAAIIMNDINVDKFAAELAFYSINEIVDLYHPNALTNAELQQCGINIGEFIKCFGKELLEIFRNSVDAKQLYFQSKLRNFASRADLKKLYSL